MKTIIRVKQFEEHTFGTIANTVTKRKVKRGASLVCVVLGGAKDGEPFDAVKAFDELARENGYTKAAIGGGK